MLQGKQARQTLLWSRVWLWTVVVYTLAMNLLAMHQLLSPWGLRHHAHFYGLACLPSMQQCLTAAS